MTRQWSHFDRPIPPRESSGTALDYHDIPVDLAAPQAGEPLVDVAAYGIASESFYARRDRLNAPYYRSFSSAPERVRCRKGVAEKLALVNSDLGPLRLELYVVDGFRPIECQTEVWEHFLNEARRVMPAATPEELVRYAGTYSSNPTGFAIGNPTTWPTHCTGGALDLTLRRRDTGELLFMGGVFDDATPISHTRYYEEEHPYKTSTSSLEARRNRRMLYWSMTAREFINYSFEWWHFDLGTQMWVMNGGRAEARRAVYGPAAELVSAT